MAEGKTGWAVSVVETAVNMAPVRGVDVLTCRGRLQAVNSKANMLSDVNGILIIISLGFIIDFIIAKTACLKDILTDSIV